MKTSIKKTILASAVSLGLGLGIANPAHAVAYAVSSNNVTNLVISPLSAVVLQLPSSINSSATACLPNGTCVNTGGAGDVNAAPAQIGIALPDNSYAPAGELVANSYSRADASIDSQQTLGDPFTQARNVAEGLLLETNTANATAGNSSGTVFTTTFDITTPGTLNFRFDADPFIRVLLSAGSIPVSQAEGSLAVSFSIFDSTGASVFDWAPNGGAGGITGGTENADAFTLNTSRLALPGNIGPLTYDPANCAVGSIATGCFNATTDELATGTYTLNLSMRETINLQQTTVPEPAMLGLMGLGLAGLSIFRRRKMV